MADIGIKSTQN